MKIRGPWLRERFWPCGQRKSGSGTHTTKTLSISHRWISCNLTIIIQRCSKRWLQSCMNSWPAAGGSQDAECTQSRNHLLEHLCTACKQIGSRAMVRVLFKHVLLQDTNVQSFRHNVPLFLRKQSPLFRDSSQCPSLFSPHHKMRRSLDWSPGFRS